MEVIDTYENTAKEFYFPAKLEQLQVQPAEPDRFWVKNIENDLTSDEGWVLRKLDSFLQTLSRQQDCQQINDNKIFDFIYSIIVSMEEVSLSVRKETLKLLNIGLRQFLKLADANDLLSEHYLNRYKQVLLQGEEPDEILDINICRNTLKSYIFLISNFILTNTKIQEEKELQLKLSRKVASSKRAGAANQNKFQTDLDKQIKAAQDIQEQKKVALRYFIDILDLDIQYLWVETQKVEEDVIRTFLGLGFDMLLAQNKQKTKDLKKMLFEIMQNTMHKYGSQFKYFQEQSVTKIIELIYAQEDMAENMADLVALIAEKQGSQIPNEIVRELAKYIFDNNLTSGESLVIKNVSIFFRKFSKRSAKSLYNNIGLLLRLFECDAYMLRQAIIKILANIMVQILSTEQIDEHIQHIYQETQKKFVVLILKRFYDKSVYCRVKAIQAFIRILNCDQIKLEKEQFSELLKLTIDKIKDPATNVRKNALKLYGIMIHYMVIILKSGQEEEKLFGVNNDDKFPTRQRIQADKQLLEKDAQEMFKRINHARIKAEKIERETLMSNGKLTQEELIQLLNNNEEYQIIQRSLIGFTEIVQQYDGGRKITEEREEILDVIDDSIEFLIQVLASKTQYDTIETIKILTLFFQFGIETALIGIRSMLNLIFSKDEKIHKAVLESYHSLFLNQNLSATQKTNNLLEIVSTSNTNQLTCLEEVIKKLFQGKAINQSIMIELIQRLHLFKAKNLALLQDRKDDNLKTEYRNLIKLIRIIGCQSLDDLVKNSNEIFSLILSFFNDHYVDYFVLKEVLIIFEHFMIQCIRLNEDMEQSNFSSEVLKILINNFGTSDQEWFMASETYLNIIFKLKSVNGPTLLLSFIKSLTKQIFNSNQSKKKKVPERDHEMKENQFSQLFFVVGHAACKMLIQFDNQEEQIKQLGQDQVMKQQLQDNEEEKNEEEKEKDELELICGGLEAIIEKQKDELKRIQEENFVQDGVLGVFFPILINISKVTLHQNQNQRQELSLLQRNSIFAMCKIMCVSQQICQQHLTLLFDLLRSNIDQYTKGNIIIVLGDLYQRFPNIFDEKIKDLFMLLHNNDYNVRINSLLVLIHLILNDMIKLKGEIVDICMHLDDPDKKIADHVQLFLQEMFIKDSNSLYNLFSKALSRLSREFPDLEKEKCENIIKNLLNYVQKDKQSEQLVEKLCSKLKNSHNQVEQRNSAFCFTVIKLNEKAANKLVENLDMLQSKFSNDQEIMGYFRTVAQLKGKRNLLLRTQLSEFENRLNDGEKMKDIKLIQNDEDQDEEMKNEDEDQQQQEDQVMLNTDELIEHINTETNPNNQTKKRNRQEISGSIQQRPMPQQQQQQESSKRSIIKVKRQIEETKEENTQEKEEDNKEKEEVNQQQEEEKQQQEEGTKEKEDDPKDYKNQRDEVWSLDSD